MRARERVQASPKRLSVCIADNYPSLYVIILADVRAHVFMGQCARTRSRLARWWHRTAAKAGGSWEGKEIAARVLDCFATRVCIVSSVVQYNR